jgi:hypothetical protein
MDKVDRRKMLTYGGTGMGISLLVMSFSMKSSHGSFTAAVICVIALTIYIAFFSATWGPVLGSKYDCIVDISSIIKFLWYR